MLGRCFCSAAFVLAAATLGAQTAAPAKTPPAAAPAATSDRYVPPIMQERNTTVTGCLHKNTTWTLTAATLAGQKDTASYRLEGLGDARLALFDGKRVEATGATVFESRSSNAKTAGAATAAKNLPVFEATAVKEATGTCQ